MGAALGRYLAAVGAALTQCVTAGAEELTSSRDDEDAPTSSEVTEGGLATLAGDGSCGWKLTGNPRTTSVYAPFGVAADAVHVYAALHDSDRIIRIPRGGGPPEVVAGGGDSETDGALAQRARIQNPRGLALSRGHLYFCTGHKVRCLAPGGRVSTVAGTGAAGHGGDGGPAGEALLNTPVGVAVHEGTLYIACYKEGRVRGVDLKTNTIVTVAGLGTAPWRTCAEIRPVALGRDLMLPGALRPRAACPRHRRPRTQWGRRPRRQRRPRLPPRRVRVRGRAPHRRLLHPPRAARGPQHRAHHHVGGRRRAPRRRPYPRGERPAPQPPRAGRRGGGAHLYHRRAPCADAARRHADRNLRRHALGLRRRRRPRRRRAAVLTLPRRLGREHALRRGQQQSPRPQDPSPGGDHEGGLLFCAAPRGLPHVLAARPAR
eukprot:TRINITY_DN1032_c0_g1_i1.p1 TRINITY_DN1032_c0_g1~~TRINITY_DN1032_c0_g1_i1.p1  ORF type:complete len:456 (+),score=18.10 TRINITY_DN1032_c0_g1_i1:74-1369(+)